MGFEIYSTAGISIIQVNRVEVTRSDLLVCVRARASMRACVKNVSRKCIFCEICNRY